MPGVEYTFLVSVKLGGNIYATSKEMTVKTLQFDCSACNLKCAEVDETSITLKWVTLPNINDVIYIIHDVTHSTPGRTVGKAQEGLFIINNLDQDTEYKFCISVLVEGYGESKLSDPPLVVRTAKPYVPPKVPGARVERVTCDKAVVSWDKIPDGPNITRYFVSVRCAAITFDTSPVYKGTWNDFVAAGQSFTCDNLKPDTDYIVTVYAGVNGNNGEPTVLSVHTKAPIVLGLPKNLRITKREFSSLGFVWDKVKCDSSDDKVLYKTFLDDKPLAQKLEDCEFICEKLEPKKAYTFSVVAFIPGTTTESKKASVRCETLEHFVPLPANFRYTSVDQTEATVAWDPVTEPLLPGESLFYRVTYRKDYEDNSSSIVKEIDGSKGVCEFKAGKLTPSTSYVFTLHVSCDGCKTYTKDYAKITVRTKDQPIPTPTGLVVTDKSMTKVTVVWNRIPEYYHGKLIFCLDIYKQDNMQQPVNTYKTSDIMVDVKDLEVGTDYVARLFFMRDNNGERGAPTECRFSTNKESLLPPLAINANCDTFDNANVTWVTPAIDEAIPKEDVCYIVVVTDGKGVSKEYKVDGYSKDSLVLNELKPNTNYNVVLTTARRSKDLKSAEIKTSFKTPGVPIPDPAPSDFKVDVGTKSATFHLIVENPLFDGPNPRISVSVNGKSCASEAGCRGPIVVDDLIPGQNNTLNVQYTDVSNGAAKTKKISIRTKAIESSVLKPRDGDVVILPNGLTAVKTDLLCTKRLRGKPSIIAINKRGPIALAFSREFRRDEGHYTLVGLCQRSKLSSASMFGDGYFLDIETGTKYAGPPLFCFGEKAPKYALRDTPDGKKRVDMKLEQVQGTVNFYVNDVLMYEHLPQAPDDDLVPVVSLMFKSDAVDVL